MWLRMVVDAEFTAKDYNGFVIVGTRNAIG
jgi:hypothetical protein